MKDLQKAAQERTLVNDVSLTAKAEEAFALTIKLNQPPAAISAILVQGKLNGILVEKHDHSSQDGSMTPQTVAPTPLFLPNRNKKPYPKRSFF